MFSLLHNELKLLIKSKLTSIFILVTVFFSILGMNAIDFSNSMSLHGIAKTSYTIALGIAKYGAIAGAVFFGVFTLMIFSKDKRKNSKILIGIRIDYHKILFIRMTAIIILAVITVLISMVFEFLIQTFILEIPYDIGIYVFSYGVIMLPSIVFSILICVGMYLISDSLDISFLAFGGLFLFGLTTDNYLLRWVQVPGEVFSDFGGITVLQGTIVYNRLFWSFISLAIVFLGVVLRRRYELNVLEVFQYNIRSGYIPIILISTIISTGIIYAGEPYTNPKDSALNVDIPVDERVELCLIDSDVTLYPQDQKLSAKVKYKFRKSQGVEYIKFVTNIGLQIESVMVNGIEGIFKYKGDSDIIEVNVPTDHDEVTIEMTYKGKIKLPGAEAVTGYITKESVYLLENSHWIFYPLTNHVKKTKISGTITAPQDLTVIPVGKLTNITKDDNNQICHYETVSSSADIGVFASTYDIKRINMDGINIEVYYAPKHKEYIGETKILNYIEDIVRYYKDTLGDYAFPDVPLKIVEVPIYKTGGHSTMNVVTIAEYMFNRDKLEGEPKENYILGHDIEIIAHEIAHQWWGSGVEVEMDAPWSSEGLANYMAYKYVSTVFEPWVAEITHSGWEYAVRKAENSYYRDETTREYLNGKLQQKLKAEHLHTLLYCKMPLVLIEMEKSKGESEFLSILSRVYQKYLHRTVSYEEFMKEVGGVLNE